MKNKRGGFTLVEVMTAILLSGMLLLLIFPMRRMLVHVLDQEKTREHAEMLGDAVFRYVSDGLQTGSIQREELEKLSLDAFCEAHLVPEISVEDEGEYRVLIQVQVSEGKQILYERDGNILYPGASGVTTKTDGNAGKRE